MIALLMQKFSPQAIDAMVVSSVGAVKEAAGMCLPIRKIMAPPSDQKPKAERESVSSCSTVDSSGSDDGQAESRSVEYDSFDRKSVEYDSLDRNSVEYDSFDRNLQELANAEQGFSVCKDDLRKLMSVTELYPRSFEEVPVDTPRFRICRGSGQQLIPQGTDSDDVSSDAGTSEAGSDMMVTPCPLPTYTPRFRICRGSGQQLIPDDVKSDEITSEECDNESVVSFEFESDMYQFEKKRLRAPASWPGSYISSSASDIECENLESEYESFDDVATLTTEERNDDETETVDEVSILRSVSNLFSFAVVDQEENKDGMKTPLEPEEPMTEEPQEESYFGFGRYFSNLHFAKSQNAYHAASATP
jgi:hypothetical protein